MLYCKISKINVFRDYVGSPKNLAKDFTSATTSAQNSRLISDTPTSSPKIDEIDMSISSIQASKRD